MGKIKKGGHTCRTSKEERKGGSKQQQQQALSVVHVMKQMQEAAGRADREACGKEIWRPERIVLVLTPAHHPPHELPVIFDNCVSAWGRRDRHDVHRHPPRQRREAGHDLQLKPSPHVIPGELVDIHGPCPLRNIDWRRVWKHKRHLVCSQPRQDGATAALLPRVWRLPPAAGEIALPAFRARRPLGSAW